MAKKMLYGTNEITQRMGISESTFIDLVQRRGLPAKKNDLNEYAMSVDDLKKWEGQKESVIEDDNKKNVPIPPPKGRQRRTLRKSKK